jgi:hypothetical protein
MRDDRKSGALGELDVKADPGARVVAGSKQMTKDPETAPVFFLDGERHKKRRTAIARFFTPRAISTRHRLVMEARPTSCWPTSRLMAQGSSTT